MNILLLCSLALLILIIIRWFIISSRMEEWNYYVKKHHIDEMNQPGIADVRKSNVFKLDNLVYEDELKWIILNPFKWKVTHFFSYKPGFDIIYEKYLKTR